MSALSDSLIRIVLKKGVQYSHFSFFPNDEVVLVHDDVPTTIGLSY